ncbi:transglycosylase SLT domain-containing protein [Pseudonocardia sp. GCM10023141]|uniref:transglycosylase SLT domain-containing protein n=1 Tax=Pseudonocardia sp. GCM10023141 TaxID=3252653 RepID=UPI0036164387
MSGHRSPRGRRARQESQATLARHLSAPRPAPNGPSLRTSVIATAAAIGAVSTGTLTALIPTPGDGVTTTASAAEDNPFHAVLAAASTLMTPGPTAQTDMLPVSYTDDTQSGFAAADQHLAMLGKATDIAAQLAEQHAAAERAAAENARIDQIIKTGGLNGWIAEALRILGLPQSLAPGVKNIIMKESGGNPNAINNWDSNARAGSPSQGLMQTIPVTYRNYVHPSLADRPITDPVANITAGIRYMIAHYGVGTLQAGGRSNGSGGYVGY